MHRRLALLAPLAALAASCAPRPAGPPTMVVFFTADSAKLDDPAQASIRQAADIARASPAGVVHVRGFAANDTGTNVFNTALSRTRARAVARGLMEAGVQPARILVEWRGATPYEDVPRESRRVEIVIGR
jgi:outer membrane protein OmpA-like peptidoglycan-associated protein